MTSLAVSASSAVHIGRLQRLLVSQQDAFEEREFFNILMRAEEVTDTKDAWMTDYIRWNWCNHWVFLDELIYVGELDTVLSPMALSWLNETEYLVEQAEWAASLHNREVALHKLPLFLDLFFSFLDVKVGGFIAPPSWDIY